MSKRFHNLPASPSALRNSCALHYVERAPEKSTQASRLFLVVCPGLAWVTMAAISRRSSVFSPPEGQILLTTDA